MRNGQHCLSKSTCEKELNNSAVTKGLQVFYETHWLSEKTPLFDKAQNKSSLL